MLCSFFFPIIVKPVVEVDKHQHWSNDCEFEQARMIHMGFIHSALSIQYHPDKYKAGRGTQETKKQRRETLEKILQNPPALITNCAVEIILQLQDLANVKLSGHSCEHLYCGSGRIQ